jgi:hypothetical protein
MAGKVAKPCGLRKRNYENIGQQPVNEVAADACRVVALGAKTGKEALNE